MRPRYRTIARAIARAHHHRPTHAAVDPRARRPALAARAPQYGHEHELIAPVKVFHCRGALCERTGGPARRRAWLTHTHIGAPPTATTVQRAHACEALLCELRLLAGLRADGGRFGGVCGGRPGVLPPEGGRVGVCARGLGVGDLPRGVGVLGRPLLRGGGVPFRGVPRGVGVFREGLRLCVVFGGPGAAGFTGSETMVSAMVIARLRGGDAASTCGCRTPRCEFHARACGGGPTGRCPTRNPSEEGRDILCPAPCLPGIPGAGGLRTATALRSLSSTGATDSSFMPCFLADGARGCVCW